MKKILSGLIVLAVLLSLGYALPAKAAPATLAGAAATVDVGAIKAINTLTVTEAGIGEITAANDLRIRIPAAVNAMWDVADLTATITVTAGNIVVSNTVSYPNSRTLLVNVTTTSGVASTFTIADLSYIGVIGAGVATLLEFSIDGGTVWNNANAGTTLQATDGTVDTLTGVTAAPTNNLGSVAANYTIAFTVPATGVITKNGKIKVTFPAGFDVTGATAGALTNIDGGVALGVVGQVVTLTRDNIGTNSLAGAKAVVINNIVNPAAGGNYTVTVRTDTSGDELLATADSAAFSIISQGGWSGGGSSSRTPSDVIAPTSTITDPIDGSTITAGQSYTVKGTAKDEGGSITQEVEISLDEGKSWQKAQEKSIIANVFYWEYVWQNPTEGNYTIKSRATDEIGNIEIPGTGIKVTVAAVVPPTPPTPPEKPITEMTVQELEAKILEIQQNIINLLQQLIQLIQQQIQALQA